MPRHGCSSIYVAGEPVSSRLRLRGGGGEATGGGHRAGTAQVSARPPRSCLPRDPRLLPTRLLGRPPLQRSTRLARLTSLTAGRGPPTGSPPAAHCRLHVFVRQRRHRSSCPQGVHAIWPCLEPSYGKDRQGRPPLWARPSRENRHRGWLLSRVAASGRYSEIGRRLAHVARPTQPLIAFPLALPMGWIESTPYFTAFTETACDLANDQLRACRTRPTHRTEHRLEAVAATPPPDPVDARHTSVATRPSHERSLTGRPPVAAVDVYVDDFLLLAQTEARKRQVMRSTLTAIDQVFRPLMPTDPPHRKEPASVKKMLQGDACWATSKCILGWDLNTVDSTLTPPHRLDRLYELLSLIRPPLAPAAGRTQVDVAGATWITWFVLGPPRRVRPSRP